MAGRRSFKSDVSFLEKISMGAIGTQRVFDDLINQGHNPVELERGSMGFKLWKRIKIKRIRVPDILCVACARRVESRAKTSFEISMSHSVSDPQRGWDYGLDDSDFVSIVVCRRAGERPIDWQADELVQYISVHELRSAEVDGRVILVRPKGAEEGFEARINWPAAVAKSPGTVLSVKTDRLQYRRAPDNRIITLRLSNRGIPLISLVAEGESVIQAQVLAAVVPVVAAFPCPQSASYDYYLERLSSLSLSDRYTATKALSSFPSENVFAALAQRLSDHREHIYVRLEAPASLARSGDKRGWAFVSQCLEDAYLENRLEAVIILGEIAAETSIRLLINVLEDDQQHPEIRAGAAWALGELHDRSALIALIESFAAVDESIRVEAARALAKLALHYTPDIIQQFNLSTPDKRPGIAWALSRAGAFTLDDMLDSLVDTDARHWVAYILGSQDQRRFAIEIERLRENDPQVYFAATVLWKIMTSWVYNLEEYG
jgi:hypothetical protein